MGINISKGEVTIAGKTIDRDKLLENTERDVAKATEWLPHARARIREATIIRLKFEHPEMTWREIGKHPDVRLTAQGVITAYYRTVNRWLDPEEVASHVSKSLRTIDLVNDLALQLYDKKTPIASVQALNTVIKAEERKSKLLGLDKPIKIDNRKDQSSVLDMLAHEEAVTDAEIAEAQDRDPVIRPNDAKIDRDNIVPTFDAGAKESALEAQVRLGRNAYVPLDQRTPEELAALDDEAKEFLRKFEMNMHIKNSGTPDPNAVNSRKGIFKHV